MEKRSYRAASIPDVTEFYFPEFSLDVADSESFIVIVVMPGFVPWTRMISGDGTAA